MNWYFDDEEQPLFLKVYFIVKLSNVKHTIPDKLTLLHCS